MNQTTTYSVNHQQLSQLMQSANISNFEQLSEVSGVSQWQLNRLLVGLMPKLSIETLLKLSKALKVPLEQLLVRFEIDDSLTEDWQVDSKVSSSVTPSIAEHLQQEYQHLQQQLKQQKETLEKEFQQSSLAVLESWLLQWPTAAIVAQKNPQLSAVKLLPLVKPIFELLKQWGLEMNATVGETIPYNPQFHQLLEGGGTAEPGDLVVVRYVGYRQGGKLLHRAKVSPVKKDEESGLLNSP
ncbi:helix-turn-helix transcriptional regulator [Crocosphaera sp. XPORK-15E]|uniref:helix-turn-helix transcriptional regulator n=1 Tax=Crocosphaera sp. XPORK-15E TaxID=3110247 RepID=UPI002B1F8C45|nr:helix-turn-helix transcriptional regulator [Crocosphaera sp. XPORK-15E]MEA5535772.1 helix-turn-helix transcriptional regulator [Crocosphaera sp. XPORK-15E]